MHSPSSKSLANVPYNDKDEEIKRFNPFIIPWTAQFSDKNKFSKYDAKFDFEQSPCMQLSRNQDYIKGKAAIKVQLVISGFNLAELGELAEIQEEATPSYYYAQLKSPTQGSAKNPFSQPFLDPNNSKPVNSSANNLLHPKHSYSNVHLTPTSSNMLSVDMAAQISVSQNNMNFANYIQHSKQQQK